MKPRYKIIENEYGFVSWVWFDAKIYLGERVIGVANNTQELEEIIQYNRGVCK